MIGMRRDRPNSQGTLIAAMTLAVIAGMVWASGALAGDVQVVQDPGFEKSKCQQTVDSCVNESWPEDSSFIAPCLETKCGGTAADGKGYALLRRHDRARR